MIKLLGLLNPKTTTFEVAGTGSVRSITQADICSALSYSQMSELSHLIIRAKCLDETQLPHLDKIAYQIVQAHPVQFQAPIQIDAYILQKQCAIVALSEFAIAKYDYKPSGRKRAKQLGMVLSTYQRYKLDHVIDTFYDLINDYYLVGWSKLRLQFMSLFEDDCIY